MWVWKMDFLGESCGDFGSGSGSGFRLLQGSPSFNGEGDLEESVRIIRVMLKKRYSPNVSTFSILINSLCSARKNVQAFDVFKDALKMDYRLETQTYNTLLTGFSKADMIEEAIELYELILERDSNPDLITLAVLTEKLCEHGKIKEAEGLVDAMTSKGFKRDISTYGTILKAYYRAEEIDGIARFVMEMKRNSIFVDPDLYKAVTEDPSKLKKSVDMKMLLKIS